VYQFERTRDGEKRFERRAVAGFVAGDGKNRADSFPSGERAVPDGRVDYFRIFVFRREESIEYIFDYCFLPV
jgi:hypothetical protein